MVKIGRILGCSQGDDGGIRSAAHRGEERRRSASTIPLRRRASEQVPSLALATGHTGK
jgi:hypothetical protein